jgi:PAS domain S-box-containing protein
MNEAAERLVGWKNEEVIGKLWFDFVPMVDENGNMLPEDERLIKQAISNKKLSSFTTPLDNYYFIRKDKTKFPVSVVAAPIILNRKVIGAIGVYQDITREKEIDKAKSEFVSLASHQLRTPLGIMKWYLEALENEDYMKKSPRMIRNYFDEISDSNERVLSLVRD